MGEGKQTNIVTVCIALTVLLPLLAWLLMTGGCDPDPNSHRMSRQEVQDARLRGIQQAMVTYANGNGGFYPGRKSDGSADKLNVEDRYAVLLKAGYLYPADLVGPLDGTRRPPANNAAVTEANYSYAMLQVPMEPGKTGERRSEWCDTVNADAAVVCDRDEGNQGKGEGKPRRSVHASDKWIGSIAYNDNHVSFESTQKGGECVLASTKYGPIYFKNDEIWTPRAEPAEPGAAVNPDDNCLMVNSGN